MSTIDRVLLGHAVSLLALELEKPVALRAEQGRLNGIAVNLLLNGRLKESSIPTYLLDAADDNACIRILVVRAGRDSGVAGRFDAAFREQGRTMYADAGRSGLRIILRGSDSVDFVTKLLREVPVREVKRYRLGLSRPMQLSEVTRAVEQANIAVELANSESRLVEYNLLAGSALVTSPPSRAVLKKVADCTFAALIEHDMAHSDDLMGSLRAYLEANGQWETAASLLGVHRHTLRGRLRRIELMLECDLAQARVRAELLLALLVRDTDTA